MAGADFAVPALGAAFPEGEALGVVGFFATFFPAALAGDFAAGFDTVFATEVFGEDFGAAAFAALVGAGDCGGFGVLGAAFLATG